MEATTDALPRLRLGLSVHAAPARLDGSPTVTVHDPLAGRFHRLGWLEAEMLKAWSVATAVEMADSVESATGIRPSSRSIAAFTAFLAREGLLETLDETSLKNLGRTGAATSEINAGKHVKRAFNLRFRLWNPDRFLILTLPLLAPFFTRTTLFGLVGLGLLGLILASRQWDVFLQSLSVQFSPAGALQIAAMLPLLKLVHELGHAYAARRFGCRVPSMGVVFIAFWPIFFTDTTEAWKLSSRLQRLLIASAGVLAELAVAVLALLIWSLTSDGTVRSITFLAATTAWVTSLVVNLNPFIRFDGYFILCDLLDMPNLYGRAMAMARWWVREKLFAYGDLPPEPLVSCPFRFFLVYAAAAAVYRLVLGFTIALLIYSFVFKLLGILLFLLYVWYFVVTPMIQEFATWWKRRRDARITRTSAVVAVCLASTAAVLTIPWPSTVRLPALLVATEEVTLHSPRPALVVEVSAVPGRFVRRDQLLLRLSSPDLSHEINQIERRLAALLRQRDVAEAMPDVRHLLEVYSRRADVLASTRKGLLEELARLTVRAPGNGRVVYLAEGLHRGRWVDVSTPLLRWVGGDGYVIEAVAGEKDIGSLEPDMAARFIPYPAGMPSIEGTIARTNTVASVQLPRLHFASSFGGPVPVRPGADRYPIPVEPQYLVTVRPMTPVGGIAQQVGGWLHVPTSPTIRVRGVIESLITHLWKEGNF